MNRKDVSAIERGYISYPAAPPSIRAQIDAELNDVVARAKAALEGVSEGPWRWDEESEFLIDPNDEIVPAFNRFNTEFIAAARSLVPELVAEVERLRRVTRCPRCASMNTRVMPFEEDPSIVCDDCRYGT